jgi:hypothetical protein
MLTTYLLHQQLPINPHRRPLILPTILPQSATHFSHPIQTVPTVQQILNILGHDLRHVLQLILNLVQVRTRPRILVRLLGLLDECVELHERVRPTRRAVVLRGRVDICEFGGQVGEVREGEFAWVRGVADAQEDYGVLDQIASPQRLVFTRYTTEDVREGRYVTGC